MNEIVSNHQGSTPVDGADIAILLGKAIRAIDISLELDARNFRMRTYAGFKRDMQYETEIIKDYEGGLGQLVRGVHMRLHAGTHIDAPSHMIRGGKEMHELPLNNFIGPAMVTDLRHRGPGEAITAEDIEKSVGAAFQPGDRLLLRTDINKTYDGSKEWMGRAPYLSDEAVEWCARRGAAIVGFDFYHANEPKQDGSSCTTRKLLERSVLTMPYVTNLWSITKPRVTLIAFPIKMINVEASPIRAIVLED